MKIHCNMLTAIIQPVISSQNFCFKVSRAGEMRVSKIKIWCYIFNFELSCIKDIVLNNHSEM